MREEIQPILNNLISNLGYNELYPPQKEAINQGVLKGQNIILSTPTASGKTFVGILAAIKTILIDGGKVVYLSPLRALASEKYEEFQVLESFKKNNGHNIRISISTGDYDSSGESFRSDDLIVLTNERFDSILRHKSNWLNSVKLFIVDEVHLVGNANRGPTLEIILTKIKFFSSKSQILALSATISNSKDIADWLNAKLVETDWRPVKLIEGVYDYGKILFSDGAEKSINNSRRGAAIDLAIDIVNENGQALIFAETRRRAVSLAMKASEITTKYLKSEEKTALEKLSAEIISSSEETTLSQNLAHLIAKGTAFHHAGLSLKHRRIVEYSYKKRLIKILTATPTLAAGVNLPARRVIISSLARYDSEYGGQIPISILDYKQMCGRAGRPKFDTIGETIPLASLNIPTDEIFDRYIHGTPEPIKSQLSNESALRIHLLALIVSKPGILIEEILNFFSETLYSIQNKDDVLKDQIYYIISYLEKEDFIKKRLQRYTATVFGIRIAQLYIDPSTGVLFRDILSYSNDDREYKAGILFLIAISPDFSPKLTLRNKDYDQAQVYIDEHRHEFLKPLSKEGDHQDIADVFRTVLVLDAWINESSEENLLKKYGVEPGDLYRLTENADWLLYSLYEISKLKKTSFILPQIFNINQRIKYGVKPELLQLVGLENIGRIRARSLYNSGFIDRSTIAHASIRKLSSVQKIGPSIAKKIKEQAKTIL